MNKGREQRLIKIDCRQYQKVSSGYFLSAAFKNVLMETTGRAGGQPRSSAIARLSGGMKDLLRFFHIFTNRNPERTAGFTCAACGARVSMMFQCRVMFSHRFWYHLLRNCEV